MAAYRISFTDEAEAKLSGGDREVARLFANHDPYTSLAFAFAQHGEDIRNYVTDLVRARDEKKQKVMYCLKLPEPLPENVRKFAENFLVIEELTD